MYHTYCPLKFRVSKAFMLLAICLTGLVVLSNSNLYYNGFKNKLKLQSSETQLKLNEYFKMNHKEKVEEFYNRRKNWKTSNLGSMLYKNIDVSTFSGRKNMTFNILIWRHLNALKNRHFFYFGSTEHDPLEECSVKNCIFTGDDDLLNKADVVVVHLQRGVLPPVRNPRQLWVFLTDESPRNSFSLSASPPGFNQLANKFSWSMTYRSDSDVPVPYGRTVALSSPVFEDIGYLETTQLIPHWDMKRKDVLVAILMSNCGVTSRMEFLKSLKKYVSVDVFGKCAEDLKNRNSCPGHFRAECEFMSYYLFYLVLENSMCKEYMTEKMFYHAYSKGAIPIIRGPPLEDCEALLPPNSFIHVDSFATIEDLAKEIISISENEEKLISYHVWRNDFEVLNEHGFFGTKSYHMCRLCEALNYNNLKRSLYDEDRIKKFLDPARSCK